MAVYDLQEQEQLDEIKTWWKQHGNLVTGVLLAAAIGVAGWQGWNWYQGRQAGQAAVVFGVLQKAALEGDAQRLKAAAGELLENYKGSAYASLGALTAAKAAFDAGDLKTAKLQLAWVADNGKDEMRDLARLRLVAVLLDEKSFDEALKQLDNKPAPAYAARYADVRGDVLLAQDKKAEAKAAYAAGLAALDGDKSGRSPQDVQASAAYREMLQQKVDALGEAK
ncbi:MAG TPA: tetratricopeptide repeat protein [Azospira sp.]|nr:tetratricopeptide repeat protein [Azospira sp.]